MFSNLMTDEIQRYIYIYIYTSVGSGYIPNNSGNSSLKDLIHEVLFISVLCLKDIYILRSRDVFYSRWQINNFFHPAAYTLSIMCELSVLVKWWRGSISQVDTLKSILFFKLNGSTTNLWASFLITLTQTKINVLVVLCIYIPVYANLFDMDVIKIDSWSRC